MPGEMEQWLDEWRSRIVPLRQKFGFRILGAWTVAGADEFVWIITYSGPKSWEQADSDYCGSPERKAISPDPARHLAHTETRMLTDVAVTRPASA